MQAAIITFPGSNCDRDVYTVLEQLCIKKPIKIWHTETKLPKGLDLIVLPGGFSYGDYLRSGAISAKSPIMEQLVKAASNNVKILGICNGFQILTETGLLPGTLMRNKNLKFIGRDVNLSVANNNTDFTNKYSKDQCISIPIAHHDGNYFADENTIKDIKNNDQIAFYYSNSKGDIDADSNPNGSLLNIAGIFNKNKNVLGMMPHPERAADIETAGIDGLALFKSLL